MDKEIRKAAWEKYTSERRKPAKQIAKAVAEEHDVEWQEVNKYITTRIVRGRSMRKKAGMFAASASAVLLAASSVYLAVKPDKLSKANKASVLEIRKDGRASLSQIAAAPGVKRIVWSNSQDPDVYYCLNSHPQWVKTSVWNPESIKSFQDFSLYMNHRYDIKSFIGEGLVKERVIEFLAKASFTIPDSLSSAEKQYFTVLQNILQSAEWQLYFAKDHVLLEEINAVKNIHKDYEAKLIAKLEDLLTDHSVWQDGRVSLPKEATEEVSRKITPFYDALRKEATRKLEAILTPEFAKLLYKIQITDANALYAEHCAACRKQGKLPVMVYLGTAHADTFPKALEKAGLTCAVIELEGSSPRSVMKCSPEILRNFYLELAHPKELLQYGLAAENNRWTIKREK